MALSRRKLLAFASALAAMPSAVVALTPAREFLVLGRVSFRVFSLLDRDWTLIGSLDLTAKLASEAATTKAVDSVGGNNGNAGTLVAPKQTIAGSGSVSANGVLGLFRGSLWRESLNLVAHAAGIKIQDISSGVAGALPILSALDTAAFATNNGDGTFTHTWTAESNVANDGYNWVYVVEITKAAEAATPIAARRKMRAAVSAADALAKPGYAFIESLGSSQWRATINPTSGIPDGTYRYEVVARYCPMVWADVTTSGFASGIELVGASLGYGSIESPRNFAGDHLVLVHGTTHNAVIAGGIVEKSLFYDNGDPNVNVALTFYDTAGNGQSWIARNCYFYEAGNQGVLCHTSTADASGNWVNGYVQNSIFKKARSGGGLYGECIGTDNLNYGTFQQCYIEGYLLVVQTSTPAQMTDCVIRHCSQVAGITLFKNNIVQLENGSDPDVSANRNCKAFSTCPAGTVSENNLYHLTHVVPGNGLTDFAVNVYATDLLGTVRKNVFILDAASGQDAVLARFSTASGPYNYQADYNVFLHLSGNLKLIRTGAADITTFTGYQAATGKDLSSLYLDLTADVRGVNAVFVDAANGNYQFADTDVGRQVSNYCRAHGVGPTNTISHWPVIPTVDEAAALVAAI